MPVPRTALAFLSLTLLSLTAAAQTAPPIPHDYRPSSWHFFWTSDILFRAAEAHTNNDRILDVQFSVPDNDLVGFTRVNDVIGGGGGLDVAWEIDYPVSQAGATLLADLAGMRVARVDSHYDAATDTLSFVSIRDDVAPGTTWVWIPETTPAGIQSWLQSHPGHSPYAVDSVLIGGERRYHVQALAIDPAAPGPMPEIRAREVVFDSTMEDLQQLADASGARVTDIDQWAEGHVDGILEWPATGEVPHLMQIIPGGGPSCSSGPCTIHAQMERVVGWTHYVDDAGAERSTFLVVNNAWSLYAIGSYLGPGVGYQGCPGSLGTPVMTVTSDQGGTASPGSTLQLEVSPVFPGGANLLVVGFDRNQVPDLTPFGGGGCYLVPTSNMVLPMASVSTQAQAQLFVPSSPQFLGFRFYAQVAVADPFANALGFVTSNAYMITIM